ncbi:hypothetical protein ACLB1G_17245 [Oxalobacteraceae bacterium A2-2]
MPKLPGSVPIRHTIDERDADGGHPAAPLLVAIHASAQRFA